MEKNELFFPKLTRRPVHYYYSRNGDFYAESNYQSNYPKVAEDCKHRCVYCDATEKECGGEKFSLDHFRPKDVFLDKFNGILVKHPHNLHLSCQKCNVLKSKDWQGCETSSNGYTHTFGKGYVDRFRKDILKYMHVQDNGRITATDSLVNYAQNPAKYIIERLHLNRPNRVYLRQQRIVNMLSKKIDDLLAELSAETIQACEEGRRTAVDSMNRIKQIEALRKNFRAIVN